MNEVLNTVEINRLTTEISILKQQTAWNIVEIGKRLITVKEMLPHGEWGKWLAEQVEFSQEHARRFMRIAKECSNSTSMRNLPPTKVFALLDLPPDEREEFIKNNPIDEMSTRELQKVIKEKKNLEDALKKSQEAADKERKEREALENRVSQLQTELADAKISDNTEEAIKLQKMLAEAQAEVKRLEDALKKKPIDVAAVVEKIPEEVEKELAELRKKASQPGNAAAVKFKLQFDQLVGGFRELLTTLDEFKTAGPDTHEMYKSAVRALIGKMSERL